MALYWKWQKTVFLNLPSIRYYYKAYMYIEVSLVWPPSGPTTSGLNSGGS